MHQFKGQRFTRDQLVFVVEATLVSVIDRIEYMPTSGMTWEDRVSYVKNVDTNPGRLSGYERGALECAGMALAVLFAQLTDDGISIYDALRCAGKFDEAVDAWVLTTWQDHGQGVLARMKQLGQGGWTIPEAYENYPDCHKHAKAFVDELFKEYLGTPQCGEWEKS